MKSMFTLLMCVVLGATGQLLIKKGLMALKAASGTVLTLSGIAHNPVGVFLNPLIFFGFGAYGVSSLLWLTLSSKYPLSLIYPMISLGYVFVVMGSVVMFRDKTTVFTWIALALIVAGVSLLAKSGTG